MFKAIGCFTTFVFVGFLGLVVLSPGFQEGFKKGFDQSYQAGKIMGEKQKVSYGGLNLYYNDSIGLLYAEKSLKNMVEFMGDDAKNADSISGTILLIKENGIIKIKIDGSNGPINEKMKAAFAYLAHKQSIEVFEGKPVETHMCDSNMVTQEVYQPINEEELTKRMSSL